MDGSVVDSITVCLQEKGFHDPFPLKYPALHLAGKTITLMIKSPREVVVKPPIIWSRLLASLES